MDSRGIIDIPLLVSSKFISVSMRYIQAKFTEWSTICALNHASGLIGPQRTTYIEI